MNPRDLPEVVAELIIEMHEVRSELRDMRAEMAGMRKDMRTEIGGMREGMRTEMSGMREDMRAMPEQIGMSVMRALEPFLNRLLEQDDKIKSHEGRLSTLENPSI
ncbi:hypothetical protein [Hymenobacter sp. BRD67]|uniref:hypothetical protein n=1 Tax=Hymenobacter sp. BRD67 TaxID=2675877 RepID=UPI001566CCB9|nr:hypothetical protein [Hymenobacter sp. BRD67]QKG54311.1 hypothetical protein GKZ67_19045 [Hymenobacter sp. BRD67]